MSSNLLLPHKYKKIGWVILIPATVLGIILCLQDFGAEWIFAKVFFIANDPSLEHHHYFGTGKVNLTNTLVGTCFIVGGLLVSFSREKNEDEFITELRLSSLLWAVCISYILLLVAFVFVYGTPFLDVMVYNMFTTLILFIVRFNYILYRNAKLLTHEK